ncbi:MAK10-like protein [Tanacetum coccineum]|uniref:MAK10-like protein n=1 Tax=Tanacetum coccineum TaxID=301880 RepID=A0ABQ5CJ21_9ASTR
MGDENPIRTLGDYSKPSHEGYKNTIELPVGNNVVPLRSDTIRLVQNGCSFHGLRSEDPNQHLKDFLKLVDSLDLDGENRERTRLRLFQFSLRDQASNWLERLPAGSISTWEDLTTRFLAQFFPPGRTAKLRNDILIRTIDQTAGGKLRDLNPEESWAILVDLALYDNESWNDPRDFTKPIKAITLPQDVPSTSDRRLIELENQVQRLMEAHLAPTQPTHVNKITTLCEICSGPHDTQNCMENPKQAFIEYASSRTDEAGEGLVSNFMASLDARLSKFKADFKQQQSEMTNKIDTVLKAITDRIAGTLPSNAVKNLKLGTHLVLSAHSYPTMDPQCSTQIHSSINAITIHPKQPEESQVNELDFPQSSNTKFVCSKEDDGEVMFIEIIRDNDEPQNEGPNEGEGATTKEPVVEYFDTFPTRDELTYHMYLMRADEVSYKMPHKIEQYDSLSDLEKEDTKLIYLRNEEDKRRGVEYVMSKILGFYKECLELGPEYLTGIDDEGEFT